MYVWSYMFTCGFTISYFELYINLLDVKSDVTLVVSTLVISCHEHLPCYSNVQNCIQQYTPIASMSPKYMTETKAWIQEPGLRFLQALLLGLGSSPAYIWEALDYIFGCWWGVRVLLTIS